LLFIQNTARKLYEKIWLTLPISSFDLRNNSSRAPVDKASSEITLCQVF